MLLCSVCQEEEMETLRAKEKQRRAEQEGADPIQFDPIDYVVLCASRAPSDINCE